MASHDPSDDYDGGWEAGLDGGEVLTDVLLGPVHPYDRPDGYAPAHRWATRHEVVSRPFADPIERLESDGALDGVLTAERRLGPRPPLAAKKPKAKRTPPQRQNVPTADTAGGKPARQQRAACVAAELGWTVGELHEFRRRLATAQAGPFEVKENKAARMAAVAAALGVGVDVVRRLRVAEARAAAPAPRPAKRDLQSLPRTQDEMVAATLSLSYRLTSKGYPARLFEAGVLLGMTRDEVMRAVDNHIPKHQPVPPQAPVPTPASAAKATPTKRSTAVPAPPGASPQAAGPVHSKKQRRLMLIARRLGVDPTEVSRVRAARVRISAELKGLAPAARRVKLAAEVQWPFQWVADLEKMEADASLKVPSSSPAKQKPSMSSAVRSSNFCPACGCRIAVTGWCRCS